MTTHYDKLYVALKFQLHGMRFFKALAALEIGREHHTGMRKDGKTPEFQHQVEIALYAMTLKDVIDLEGLIATILLHDLFEDYPATQQDNKIISKIDPSVLVSMRRLNKHGKPYPVYFEELSRDMNGSLAKGLDRINNVQTMPAVFSIEKQKKYIEEVLTYFLPMLKKARKNFPEQMYAYYNIENMLKSQIYLLQSVQVQ